jgi:hypothetical protein
MMILSLLVACGVPDSEPVDSVDLVDAVDERILDGDWEGLSDNDLVFQGADVVIEPYADKMWCLVGTYTGPDIGLYRMKTYQGNFGHHFQIMGLTAGADVYPDGELIDCSSTGALPMADLDPLMLPTDSNHTDVATPLPEGMAYKLRTGQRYVLQSHYVNTSDSQIRVQDIVVNATVPVEEVEVWSAPLVANGESFLVPPGEEASYDFSCTYDQDYSFVYVLGHMHEWGKAMSIDIDVDGAPQTIHDVPAWEPSFRDSAPVTHFDQTQPFTLKAGTTLTTRCTWYNDTSEALAFPHEMCVSVGMVYPALVADVCSK